MFPEGRSTFRGYNTADYPRHPLLELKLEILHRCFELGEDVQSVSNEVGYSTASIYTWRRKYIQKGAAALMNPPNERVRGKLTEGKALSSEKLVELKARIQDIMRLFLQQSTKMIIRLLRVYITIIRKDLDTVELMSY